MENKLLAILLCLSSKMAVGMEPATYTVDMYNGSHKHEEVLVQCFAGSAEDAVGGVDFFVEPCGTSCSIGGIVVVEGMKGNGISGKLYEEFFLSPAGQKIQTLHTEWADDNLAAFRLARQFAASDEEAGSHTPCGKVMAKNGFYIKSVKVPSRYPMPQITYCRLLPGDEIPGFYDSERRAALGGFLKMAKVGQGFGKASTTMMPDKFHWDPSTMNQGSTGGSECIPHAPAVSRAGLALGESKSVQLKLTGGSGRPLVNAVDPAFNALQGVAYAADGVSQAADGAVGAGAVKVGLGVGVAATSTSVGLYALGFTGAAMSVASVANPVTAASAATTLAGAGTYQVIRQSPSRGYAPPNGYSTSYAECFWQLYGY